MEIKSTKNVSTNGVKILVYGRENTGKTRMISTLPDPIILSAESGLLSLQAYDFPYIEIKEINDLYEAIKFVAESEYKTIVVDSISEIAEVILASEKKKTNPTTGKLVDPRQAYGETLDLMIRLIRRLRDIPKHVYITAKQEKTQDDTGRVTFAPMMPGAKISLALPYFFDFVLCARTNTNVEKTETNYFLQTKPCDYYTAKDRSGKLDFYELSDLGEIIRKVQA